MRIVKREQVHEIVVAIVIVDRNDGKLIDGKQMIVAQSAQHLYNYNQLGN